MNARPLIGSFFSTWGARYFPQSVSTLVNLSRPAAGHCCQSGYERRLRYRSSGCKHGAGCLCAGAFRRQKAGVRAIGRPRRRRITGSCLALRLDDNGSSHSGLALSSGQNTMKRVSLAGRRETPVGRCIPCRPCAGQASSCNFWPRHSWASFPEQFAASSCRPRCGDHRWL